MNDEKLLPRIPGARWTVTSMFPLKAKIEPSISLGIKFDWPTSPLSETTGPRPQEGPQLGKLGKVLQRMRRLTRL